MKATKKLILAAISLAAASSLTVGSTFAWFSFQSNVELGEVQFSVDSGDENLQVAVTTVGGKPNSSDFTYSLSAYTITNLINDGNVVYKQLTVKEDDKVSDSDPNNNAISAENDISLWNKDGDSRANAGEFAEFDLIFRYTPVKAVDSMPRLILDEGSKIEAVDSPDGSYPQKKVYAWETTSKYGAPLSADQLIEARARDAARVAFLMKDESSGSGYRNKVWAPGEKFDSYPDSFAVVNGTNTSDSPKGFYLENLASDYDRHHNPAHDPVIAPTYKSRVYAGIEEPKQEDDFYYSAITEFPPVGENGYSELRLTVKVWLEGKDGDCLESVCGDIFAFTLKFRTSTIVSAS